MSVRDWVSDALHELLGFTAPAVVDYVIAQAQQRSASVQSLTTFILDSTTPDKRQQAETFAAELLRRLPPQAASAAGNAVQRRKEEERRKLELLRKNESYSLLDAGAEEEEEHRRSIRAARLKNRKEEDDRVKRRERKTHSDDSADDADDARGKSAGSKQEDGKRRRLDGDAEERKEREEEVKEAAEAEVDSEAAAVERMTEEERREWNKKKDLAERDAFIARLAARDQSRTKSASSSSSSAQPQAADKAVADMTREEMQALLPALRQKARESYLSKREQQQLELLRLQLQDETRLWKEEELTARERAELSRKRRLLELAQQRKGLSAEVAGYHLPDSYVKDDGTLDVSKREALLRSRYVEEGRKESEQEGWEREQKHKSDLSVGSKGRQSGTEGYDFVFDDSIEFEQAEHIAGSAAQPSAAVKHEQDEQRPLSEAEQMQLGRRKLPIFPYREELLAAIAKYQTLIVVGETGSGKCFAAGTQLRLYNGDSKAVETFVGGELLMGDDGSPRVVTAGSLTTGRAQLFTVCPHLDAASPFTVNGAHILVLVNNVRPCRSFSRHGGWSVCWYELQTADNSMRHRRRIFDTEAAAERELVRLCESWRPLEWEVSVDDFCAASAHVRSACQMFHSAPVTFHSSLPSLPAVLSLVLAAQANEQQTQWAAWYLGLWLAAARSDSSSICLPHPPQRSDRPQQDIAMRLLEYAALFSEPVVVAQQTRSVSVFHFGSSAAASVAHRLLSAYGLLHNPHVPHACICDSLLVRRHLLAGIIDAAARIQGKQCDVLLRLRSTAEDVKLLAGSLGVSSGRVVECQKPSAWERGFCVTISGAMAEVAQCCASARKRTVLSAAAAELDPGAKSRCFRLQPQA